MPISPLVVDAPPSGDAALRDWLSEMEAALQDGTRLAPCDVSGAAAMEGVRRLKQMSARLAAVTLGLLARVDDDGEARRATGATSTAGWLRSAGQNAGAANREVALAHALSGCGPTRDALGSGRISVEQAAVIVDAVGALSGAVADDARVVAQERLIAQADVLDPTALRKSAAALAVRIDPEAQDGMARRELELVAARELVVSRGRDGLHRLMGVLDPEGAAHLLNALDPLSRPRPSTAEGQDMRSPARRRADALVELAQIAAGLDALPDSGGARPTVLVSIDWATLRGQVADAGLLTAGSLREPVSVERVRKLACDAQVLPVVLGGDGVPLDLGRDERSATRYQRLALIRRDGAECAFPGCDRPAAWTRAHHLVPWSEGGRTDLANLVLVCGPHHDCVHHHGWTVRMLEGHPCFEPPAPPPPDPPPEEPPDDG
jgi:hypothetical protein